MSEAIEKFGVPVIICETGFESWQPEKASEVMHDLMNRMKAIPQCAGVFYWEPSPLMVARLQHSMPLAMVPAEFRHYPLNNNPFTTTTCKVIGSAVLLMVLSLRKRARYSINVYTKTNTAYDVSTSGYQIA